MDRTVRARRVLAWFGMHRDFIREAEIQEEELVFELPHLRGEMACVADPDACGDSDVHEDDAERHDSGDDDEDLPETLKEPITLPSPSQQERFDLVDSRV